MNYIRENFKKTVIRLRVAVNECSSDPTDLMIDGMIQRFEFCVDFALKSCLDFLDTAGNHLNDTPMEILTTAKEAGLIDDYDLWFAIIKDKEASSQIYDKAAARKIARHIREDYLSVFQSLAKKFS